MLYYVISVDNTRNVVKRIEYIKNNFLSIEYTFVLPLLSVIFLIFIYPYAAIFVYRVVLKFNKQKRDIKNKIENEQCLTIRESLEIREEIEKQEDKFQVMTRRNDDEIKRLRQEVELYKGKLKIQINEEKKKANKAIKEYLNDTKNIIAKSNNDSLYDEDFLKFKNSGSLEDLKRVSTNINENYNISNGVINTNSISYFIASELIEMIKPGYYKLTKKGKHFLKKLFEDQAK